MMYIYVAWNTGEYLTKDEMDQFIEENSSFIGEMIYEWCN